MANLASFINRQIRNNLLFTSYEVEGINHVDIGRLLANGIADCLQKKRLDMVAEDALKNILNRSLQFNEEIGEYLAIKNIGILFEPALHFDVSAIFSSWSREYVLIVKHEGVIKDNKFYLEPHSTKYFINLKDVRYKIIS